MYRIATLIIGVLVLSYSALAQNAIFEGLGGFLPEEDSNSIAFAISGDGSAIVGSSYFEEGTEAFMWTEADGMVGLGHLPGGSFLSQAAGVSFDGSVVVGVSWIEGTIEAFRWTPDTGMEGLGFLLGGKPGSRAYDVSGNGQVIVGHGYEITDGASEAFRWTEASGRLESLGMFSGGYTSVAYGVSGDGSIIGGYGDNSAPCVMFEAFRWTEETGIQGLGHLPGNACPKESVVWAVSADGSTLVGHSTSDPGLQEAFRWTEAGGMENLGDLPGGGTFAFAYGVSADGSVVVGTGNGALGQEVFVWRAQEGMRSLKDILQSDYGLDLTGWTLAYASDVSDDGTVIVGYGVNPDGHTEAWRAILPRQADTPENDNIADATVIATVNDMHMGSNVNATLEDGEPEPSCAVSGSSTNHSVWWTFMPEEDGRVTINVIGDINPAVSLHNAADLSEVACGDEGSGGAQSYIEQAPIFGRENYLIRVAGYNESPFNQGQFRIEIEFNTGAGGPENDNIADATFIPSANGVYMGSNVNATLEDGEPEVSCAFADWATSHSVWWTFTAEGDNNRVDINTFGSSFDTVLSLHRADDLSEVACDDDTDGLQSHIVDAVIVEGETYLIRVAGYNNTVPNQGDIRLTTEFHTVSGEPGSETRVTTLTAPSPNPVRGTAAFTLTVDREQSVIVEVFDVMGRRVQTLYEGSLSVGSEKALSLDTSNLSAGVYVIRASGENFFLTQRVTVVQ